jgi:hypothetical protein
VLTRSLAPRPGRYTLGDGLAIAFLPWVAFRGSTHTNRQERRRSPEAWVDHTVYAKLEGQREPGAERPRQPEK